MPGNEKRDNLWSLRRRLPGLPDQAGKIKSIGVMDVRHEGQFTRVRGIRIAEGVFQRISTELRVLIEEFRGNLVVLALAQ